MLQDFLSANVSEAKNGSVPASEVFERFTATGGGGFHFTRRAFCEALRERHFHVGRGTGNIMFVKGIRLIEDMSSLV